MTSLTPTLRLAARPALAACGAALLATHAAHASLYINEINVDPPGGNDNGHEFLELRGTPGASLDDHWLVVVENEISGTANAGLVEFLVDLSGQSVGSNGFVTLSQSNLLPSKWNFEPTATNLQATSGSFFTQWAGLPGLQPGSNNDKLENSGGTYFVVQTNPTAPGYTDPTAGYDIDPANDGSINWPSDGYSVLDSIGFIGESSELAAGALYGAINFGPGALGPGFVDITTGDYVSSGFEIEYLARLGNSTGSTTDDWHAANLTDDPRRPGSDISAVAPYAVLSAADGPGGDHTGPLETTRPDLFFYGQSLITHGVTNPGVIPEPMTATLAAVAFGFVASSRRRHGH